MDIRLKPINQQVIVITGASSGIGLATARAASRKGAKVVLASRNKEALQKIEQELNQKGGQAIHVVADVGNSEDVQQIAATAVQRFGGFDTWVNDAGVSIYGKLENVSEEDSRRLFDTNFWGVVSGSLIAANLLKSRGGAIINIGSELSDLGIPLQGMYAASKHAVKGFTDSLRMELEEENAPISVTLIKPAGINTPYTEHAKNYTDHELTLPPPVYEPEEVANAILHAAVHPNRDIYVGSASKLMSSLNKHIPSVVDWVNEKFMIDMQLRDERAQLREDSLHQAGSDGRIHGNYKGHVMKTSLYTRASLHPVVTGALVAAAGTATIALIGRSKMKQNGKAAKVKTIY
jgi:short-subunit dehydrogenase